MSKLFQLITTFWLDWFTCVLPPEDEIVAPPERLGGTDPASALRDEVTALGWSIEEEADLPWTLRRDSRSSTTYQVHWLTSRRR